MIYDIFYISQDIVDAESWKDFSTRFPSAQKLNNVQSIEDIKKKSFTKFFWVVWDDLVVDNNFLFDYRVPKYDEQYIHVWKNGNFYDGIFLFPKGRDVTSQEFKKRFFIADKKEIDVVASIPKPYDIIFISYNEPNAEKNYELLKMRFPRAKRVHGVTGIINAHKQAANISSTDMFWVVDGDAIVEEKFNFSVPQIATYDSYNKSTVSIWLSRNPINDLIYGYGGVKLLPKSLTLKINPNVVDMTTSISDKIKVMNEVSNLTAFNTDPFNTWKSAFRECVKLSSKIIDKNYNESTEDRLRIWCTKGSDNEFGKYALQGARAGADYGESNIDNKDALAKINDFDWLYSRFKEEQQQN